MNPNIILILCDDLGFGDISALNPNSKIITPNIDAIALKGISITDAHTTSSVCTPSRYSLLTGRYSFRSSLKSGVNWGYSPPLIEKGRLTLPQMLKNCGYTTGMVGKWHLGLNWKTDKGAYVEEGGEVNEKSIDSGIDFSAQIKDGPLHCGFDYFFGISASLDMPPYVYIENDRAAELPTEEHFQEYSPNIDGITLRQGDSLSGQGRHGPVQPNMFADEVLSTLSDKAVEFIRKQSSNKLPYFLYASLTAPHTPVSPSKKFVGKSGTNDQYLDFVLEVDEVVGRITSAVEEADDHENTLIIFTSDNGPEYFMHLRKTKIGHFSAGQFRGCKRDNWEGGHRVPFIVQWPSRIRAQTETSEVISLVDIYATIAAIVGSSYPDDVAEDSLDISPLLLAGPGQASIREVTIHHSALGLFAIRKGEWKLLLHEGSGSDEDDTSPYSDYITSPAPVQLYRIYEDEHEDRNLFMQYPEIVEELTQELFSILSSGRSTPGEKQPNHGDNNRWEQVETTIQTLSQLGLAVGNY